MANLLLHNPWVHFYLLYIGALAIAFICASRQSAGADSRPD
jgi:hypothetical protein